MKSLLHCGLFAAFVFAATACSQPGSIGESCSNSASCESGLQCIPSGGRHIVNGSLVCDDTMTLCSKPCTSDSDCASLGSGYICVNDCFAGSCLQGSR